MNSFGQIGILLFAPDSPQDLGPGLGFVLVLGVIVVALAIFAARLVSTNRRREQLSAWALRSGFAYFEESEDALATELARLSFGGNAFLMDPRFSNVMVKDGADAIAVICDRIVGRGRNQSVATILAFKPGAEMPAFTLRSENVFWRLADKLGYKDIDVEGAPEFSDRFFLHGQNEFAVRQFFDPDTIRAFEQMRTDLNFAVSATGKWIGFCGPSRRLSVEEIDAALRQLEPVVQAIRRN